jgi:hypothetical protein
MCVILGMYYVYMCMYYKEEGKKAEGGSNLDLDTKRRTRVEY